MTEMVERVARAIAGPAHAAPWGDTNKQNWEMYTTEARAAIKAMREPTVEMMAVQGSIIRDEGRYVGMFFSGKDLVEHGVWAAMIDAALVQAVNAAEE